jgi:hypothetical protein
MARPRLVIHAGSPTMALPVHPGLVEILDLQPQGDDRSKIINIRDTSHRHAS